MSGGGHRRLKIDSMAKKKRAAATSNNGDDSKRTVKKAKKDDDNDEEVNESDERSDAGSGGVEYKDDDEASSSGEDVLDSEDELRLHGALENSDDEEDPLMNVSFEFCAMKECHFRSVRQFMQYFGPGTFDASGLADVLVSHGHASTVIEVDDNDDHDAFAFQSLLSLRDHEELRGMSPVLKYLKNAGNGGSAGGLLRALSSPTSMLFVNERMVNLPAQLVPAMYETLLEDVASAKRTTSSGGEEPLRVENLIVVAPSCPGEEQGSPFFVKFDEEVLRKHASVAIKVPFSAASSSSSSAAGVSTTNPNDLVTAHWVMVVPFSRLRGAVREMSDMIVLPGEAEE